MGSYLEAEDGTIYGRLDEDGNVVPFIIRDPFPSTKEMASKCAAVITTQMKKEIEEFNKRVDNPNPKLKGIYTDHGKE